jgi:putative peptidoglycan lipid II flippase
MTLNFLFLGVILYRRLHEFSLRPLLAGSGKILTATMVMAAAVWGMKTWLSPLLLGGIAPQLIGVLGIIGAGGLIYYLMLLSLKLPELTIITEKVLQRLGLSEDRGQRTEDRK